MDAVACPIVVDTTCARLICPVSFSFFCIREIDAEDNTDCCCAAQILLEGANMYYTLLFLPLVTSYSCSRERFLRRRLECVERL